MKNSYNLIAGLSALAFAAIAVIVSPHWIERSFRLELDHNSGSLELLFVAFVLAAISTITLRRFRVGRSGESIARRS
jgi:hypothetical protein